MIASMILEETIRAAEKRIEICQHDLARAEAVLVGVKLALSALQRHEEEEQRWQDKLHNQVMEGDLR